jgi:hypothetical protein
LPPTTLVGLRVRVDSAAGIASIISVALLVTPPELAEIDADVDPET